jgi:hypothetical protein
MLIEALQARLEALEEEILRLTRLASEANDQTQQENYWRLAQDLQLEARELRLEMRKMSQPPAGNRTQSAKPIPLAGWPSVG